MYRSKSSSRRTRKEQEKKGMKKRMNVRLKRRLEWKEVDGGRGGEGKGERKEKRVWAEEEERLREEGDRERRGTRGVKVVSST